jgi:hypothetical protein
MARFRSKKTFRLVSQLRERHCGAMPAWKREEEGLLPVFQERWSALHRSCPDPSSLLRLGRLIHRLTHDEYGVRESALAELELATQLIRVGARVVFLPESQAKTADLECLIGRERFFVEVTAMVGSTPRKRLPPRNLIAVEETGDAHDHGAILIHRILARIRQKAKQLDDYGDPVVLSISIPRADLLGDRAFRREIPMDLKILAGSVTVLLTKIRHLSAVMIALWDVESLPSKAGTRLTNVDVIERPKRQTAYPRVRLLIRNPQAAACLTERQQDVFEQIL